MQKRSKYGAKRTTVGSTTYASKKESRVCEDLKKREKAGEITDLTFQNRYHFFIDGKPLRYVDSNRPVTYVDDAAYMENGERIIIDAKGVQTDVFKLKRALMRACSGREVQVV